LKTVEPKVFLIGETRILEDELEIYLNHVGASEWRSNAGTDPEKLIEVMGRLCYRSFKPGLNPNVTKIREDNKEYLKNIIESKHGSVMEHPMFNFILVDVSRVFTHEIVRHRVGVAISQESLRYVRLEELRFWMPSCFRDHAKKETLMRMLVKKIEYDEKFQTRLARFLGLDKMKSFKEKKEFTSAMRRFAPDGLATTIGWSANPRALRHIMEMRSYPGAEEEMRLVVGKIAEKVRYKYPNLFQDYETEEIDCHLCYKTKNQKV